jgi:hypothetical protein
MNRLYPARVVSLFVVLVLQVMPAAAHRDAPVRELR